MPDTKPTQSIDVAAEPLNKADGPAAHPAGGFGRSVGHGFSWLSFSLLIGKTLAFISQVALGKLLLDEDFGIFAIAMSVAAFVKVFQDGGVAQLLIQRGPDGYRWLAGPAFWMGMFFSILAGGLLALAAPVAAHLYGVDELAVLMWIIAASMPLAAPAQIARAKLQIELRFRALAMITIGSYAVRQLLAVVLAYYGFGARSFVLPILAVAVYESLATLLVTHERLWRESLGIDRWREMFSDSMWVIVASFFQGILLNGDYLVLGLLIPTELVGQYFFGYQLTHQISVLMAGNLIYVLIPVLSRLANEPDRQAKAMLRTFRISTLVLAPLSLVFAVTIAPVEEIAWQQKWAGVVPLMQVFAVVAPLRVFSSNVYSMLRARGKFRQVAWLNLLEGIVIMASAAFAVMIAGLNLTWIAVVIASCQAVFNIVLSLHFMHRWGIATADFWRAVVPGWSAAVLCAAVTLGLSTATMDGVHPIGLALANGLFFSVAYTIVMRAVYSEQIVELVAIIPSKLARPLRRILLLPDMPSQA